MDMEPADEHMEPADERPQAGLLDTSTRHFNVLRYTIGIFVTWNLFANHWSRDSIGALEIPLEEDFGFSVRQYNSLSAAYFAPNLPIPIVAGIIAQTFGPANSLLTFSVVAFVGNVFVMLGVASASVRYLLILFGRFLMGVAYEAIDVLPIGLMQPRFSDKWAMLVGIINGVNRLGSICNFLLEPHLYTGGGLTLAMLVPSLLGGSMLASALAIHRVDSQLRALERRHAASMSTGRSEEDGRRDKSDAAVAAPSASELPPTTSRLSLNSLCEFSSTYWLYLLGAACAYGCVVPFWFVGAKAIALRWNMSLAEADTFLLWPEGAIGLIAPPFGMLIDRQGWTLRTRLGVSAVALSLIPLGYAMLVWMPLPPIIGVGLLGIGYAVVQNLIWASIAMASPPALLNLSAGLIGCAVNVLPSLLPAAVLSGDTTADLVALAITGMVGVTAYLAAAYRLPQTKPGWDVELDGGMPAASAANEMAEPRVKSSEERGNNSKL